MFRKLRNSEGFSLIELIVAIAIVGILVMLGTPKFLGYVEKAELARIQYDVKIMEDKMAEDSINGVKDFVDWDDNAKDLGLLVLADLLYETEGKAKNVAKPRTQYGDVASSGDILSEVEIDSDYKVMPQEMSKRIKTTLPGTFYTNIDGKVYYEHDKPLTRVKRYQDIACESALPDYTFEHKTGTIVKYHGDAQHLTIPPAFNMDGRCYPVLIIGRGAFMHGNYREVVVPEGVVTIEDDAFKDGELQNVSIPESVTQIRGGAFSGNNFGGGSGGGITIHGRPGSITAGPNAFGGGVPSYTGRGGKASDYTFNPSTGTISAGKVNGPVLRIPETITVNGVEYPVKKIDKGAYQGKGLITVILPEGLERIEDYAFSGNQLIGITIPNSVKHIGNYAFSFNELEKVGNISGPPTKSTIKTIIIKNSEQFNKLDKYGDILENGIKVEVYKNKDTQDETEVTLLDHIFVTSHGNIVIDVIDKNNEENNKLEDIVFEGLSHEAFDNDDGTFHSGIGTVTWSGDLDNKAIEIISKGTQGMHYWLEMQIRFIDSNGGSLIPIGQTSNSVTISKNRAKTTTQVVVPEGAVKMIFSYNNSYGSIPGKIYDIRVVDNSKLPKEVTSISSKSNNSSITLNWEQNDNDSKVAIYRDDKFLTYVKGTTFTDTPLRADTDYSYGIIVMSNTGNASNKASYNAKTTRPDIIFEGLSPEAFDDDYETFHSGIGTVTWSGDLDNKAIDITTRGTQGMHYWLEMQIRFIDSNGGSLIPIGQTSNLITISKNRAKTTTQVVVPEGAVAMRFSYNNSYGGIPGRIYDVRVSN